MGMTEFEAVLSDMGIRNMPHFTLEEAEVVETLGNKFGLSRVADALTTPTNGSRKFVGLDLESAAKIAQQRIFPDLSETRSEQSQSREPDWDVLKAGLIEIQTRGGMEIDGPYSKLAPFLRSWGGVSGAFLRQSNELQLRAMIPYQISAVTSCLNRR